VSEPRRIRLCSAADIGIGEVVRVETEIGPLAVVHCSSGFRALSDVCSHEDYPLSEGEVMAEECEIECLRHGSTFSLIDGSPQSLPATRAVPTVDLEVVGDEIYAVVP